MSKTWTQRPTEQFDQVKPETLNDNIDTVLSEYNGGLDGNNIPVDSVRSSHLKAPVNAGVTPGNTDKFSVEMPTQSLHSARRWAHNQGGTDEWSPVLQIDLNSDPWKRGFNSLSDYTGFDTFPLEFEAKQGMLVGQATIDWEHGCQVYEPAGLGGVLTSRGFNWWTEWGVFVNNVLVARSGWIYPRRHTTCLPFSVPVGSQSVKIDVRFIANQGGLVGTFAGDDEATKFNVFGAELVVRNQYR